VARETGLAAEPLWFRPTSRYRVSRMDDRHKAINKVKVDIDEIACYGQWHEPTKRHSLFAILSRACETWLTLR
jgi:hypothetical protein